MLLLLLSLMLLMLLMQLYTVHLIKINIASLYHEQDRPVRFLLVVLLIKIEFSIICITYNLILSMRFVWVGKENQASLPKFTTRSEIGRCVIHVLIYS